MEDIDILWEKSESVSHSAVSDSLGLHGLKWVAVRFSRESSQPRDQIQISRFAGRFFTI